MTRLAILASLLAACDGIAPPATPEFHPREAPPPVVRVDAEVRDGGPAADAGDAPAVTAESPTSTSATFAVKGAPEAGWIRAARSDRRFRRLALGGEGPVHLAWTVIGNDEDPSSARTITHLALVIARGGQTVRVEGLAGGGDVEPEAATLCDRFGYRLSNGAALQFPPVDGLVSTFSVGDMSGSDDWLVVLAGGALHVLHGQTSDGMCVSQVRQGPLTVCRGQEYARVAEVRVGAVWSFDETILAAAPTNGGTAPLDCGAATIQGQLMRGVRR
jgi:hypothetical protein